VQEATAAVHLTDDQRLDWLRLIRSDNVGPRTFRALVNHYGGARRALTALPDLARRGGASGPPRVYSRQDAERELDAANSLGVTLVALGEPDYPRRPARDFPRRNRLISGLAVGVVVMEAARRSGSLITARFALEQGREVFAVPGSPLDPRTEGTNDLLKQGATIVTEAADVITVVRPILGEAVAAVAEEPDAPPLPAAEPGGDDRTRIVALLGPTPVAIDDLIRLSGSSPTTVRVVLLELELAGRLERHGGAQVSLAYHSSGRLLSP
jgi:DNA processing protein